MEGDAFTLREKQAQVARLVVERATERNADPVVALLPPGYGKEWAWQHAATLLMRADLIDVVMTFTPRTNLCTQAETNWYGRDRHGRESGRRLQYAKPVPHSFHWAKGNSVPLYSPPAIGYIATYQALGTNFGPHEDIARRHSGRLLIVCDEAAGLGGYGIGAEAEREEQDVLRAADRIRRLAPHAAAVLLLTGAPDRGDGKRLILCEDRYRQRDDGTYVLDADVSGSYTEGVSLGYLRPIEVYYFDAEGREITRDGNDRPVSVSEDQSLVHIALREPDVYRPMVTETIERLRGLRLTHSGLVAGVACIDTRHARDVHRFLKQCAPDLRVGIAVSEDGKDSRFPLDAARNGQLDVLVFVRQAYIGFDCPAMSVFCVLTNVRDASHLTQLTGRALRVWNAVPVGEQTAHIVSLNDARATAFFERMRTDAQLGIRERDSRDGPEPNGDRLARDIRDLRATDLEIEDMDGRIPGGAEALRLMRGERIPDTPGAVRAVAHIIAKARDPASANGEPDTPPEVPLTNRERVDALKSKAAANVGSIAARRVRTNGRSFRDVVQDVNDELGRRSYYADDCRTEAQAEARLAESIAMCEEEGANVRSR